MTNPMCPVLIESLRDPAVYDHSVRDVRVIETHISWVLLTGTHAYKIKKPVDFGFVDFSTLDKRRHFCFEELRLNRRLAPGLYLDVVPITGTPHAPRLNGSGAAIEFAVKMVEFPQEVLLTHVLERRELLAGHIDQLAQEVGEFHSRVEIAGPESPFGSPERVLQPARENFKQLARWATDEPRRGQLEDLRQWTEQEFAVLQSTFEARKRDGFIRECHGDMHLGNMILHDGSVVIFDAIEFNDDFRWIDVLNDASFCVMDLEDRGRPDLARRFLNGYLEVTGDYRGLAVLPFSLTYRALVRAKVAGLRFEQAVEAAEQERLRAEFQSYLELAERYSQRSTPASGAFRSRIPKNAGDEPQGPRGLKSTLPDEILMNSGDVELSEFLGIRLPKLLIITHGFSGSGKTSGTQPLVEKLGAIRLRSDVERKRLFGQSASGRSDSRVADGLYSAEATERTYAHLAEQAAAVLRAGFPVIVDATFLKRAQRDQFRRLAEETGVEFLLLAFQAEEETLRQRIAARAQMGHDASEADVAVLQWQLQNHEPLAPDESRGTISMNSEPGVCERE